MTVKLKTMYPAAVNSKATTTLGALDPDTTQITVLDAEVLPEAPNLLVLGSDNTAETVLLTAKDGNLLTVERGFQGIAKTWKAGTLIARNFTAYDYDVVVENIETLESNKQPVGDYATQEALEATQEEVDTLATNQNGVRNYNSFAEINPTFNATTPIITLFQAMQPNSILNCVVNQANSVYPSAQGSLNLTKMTETEGSVQFLSSDGKLSTGAFTKTNESSGRGY